MNKQLFLEIAHRLNGDQFDLFLSLARGCKMAKDDFLKCHISQKIYYKNILKNKISEMQAFLNDCKLYFNA